MSQKTNPFEPSDNHWRIKPVGTFTEKVTRKEARHVLRNKPDPIIEGEIYEWEAKHMGAGIYRLSISQDPKRD
jgi:hypothetical protein